MSAGWPHHIFISLILPLAANCFSISRGIVTSNSTYEQNYVGFVADPSGRGTASLVISCLLTLVLCVWSALHLNVPLNATTPLKCLAVNLRWIFTGVYAPELVVFTAWRQWCSAKILSNLVENDNSETKNNESSELKTISFMRAPWTMTHSFFACTGGFAFEFSDEDMSSFLPAGSPHRFSITARGMALLTRCGHLPDIFEAEIKDKSKANNVAKALVLIQAFWMLIQVLARVAAAFPVTLLEINTIAHVLCAFLMYTMWWHKPLSPKEPYIIKGEWVKAFCAYMFISSSMSGEISSESMESQTKVKTLFASLRLYSKVPEMESLSFVPDEKALDLTQYVSTSKILTPGSCAGSRRENRQTISAEEPSQSLRSGPALQPAPISCLDHLRAKSLTKAAGTAFFERRPRVKGAQINLAAASTSTINRWRLATTAIETYPAIREHYLYHSHLQDQCLHFKPEEFLVRRVHNWPSDDLLRDVGGLVVGMILWLACLAYGGIHLTAWNDHFPSDPEKWLWRSSAIYIGFCGGLWIVLNYVAQAYGPLNAFWERWMDGGGRWWHNVLIGIPVFLCGLSLILARAFIVIEAFISIRDLPAAAYDTPSWNQVFPHF